MDVRNKEIGEIGEKNFLNEVFKIIDNNDENFVNGINQDSSILRINNEIMLVSNIDKAQTPVILSDKNYDTYKTWGYLSVTSSLSDISVVGAKGLSFLISITAPSNIHSEKILKIIKGAQEACKHYGISFLGGDTKKGNELSVVGAANGIIKGSNYLTRNSSNPSELIVCTGEFGKFATAYYKLLNSIELDKEEIEYITYPKFDIKQCEIVSNNLDLFSSSMDNSDGINNLLYKMFTENNLGFEIYLDSIPFSDNSRELAKLYSIPLENFAFYVGDWNSIFTISEENFLALEDRVNKHGLHIIGKVRDDSNIKEFHKHGETYSCLSDFENDSFISTTSNTEYFSEKILTRKSILK